MSRIIYVLLDNTFPGKYLITIRTHKSYRTPLSELHHCMVRAICLTSASSPSSKLHLYNVLLSSAQWITPKSPLKKKKKYQAFYRSQSGHFLHYWHNLGSSFLYHLLLFHSFKVSDIKIVYSSLLMPFYRDWKKLLIASLHAYGWQQPLYLNTDLVVHNQMFIHSNNLLHQKPQFSDHHSPFSHPVPSYKQHQLGLMHMLF